MNTLTEKPKTLTANLNGNLQTEIFDNHQWLKFAGSLLLLFGMVTLLATLTPTLHNVTITASLLTCCSFIYFAHSAIFLRKSWIGFLLHMLSGVVYLSVGYSMFAYPIINFSYFGFILALSYIIMGMFRVSVAVTQGISSTGWFWTFFAGIADILFAYIVLNNATTITIESVKLLSLIIGSELVLSGLGIFMLGIHTKKNDIGK